MTMAATDSHPMIIQGGMGIAVSGWELARAVAGMGHLGVVSGTSIDSVLVRRLQDGDLGGHVRRAMEKFPIQQVATDVLERYFLPEGREEGAPYRPIPMYRQVVSRAKEQLTIIASFVEVTLAKEGHDGLVGVNLLTKVQMPNLHTLYGAMLAGVDYVLMGAGIPKEIPGVLDRLALHEPASIRLDVEGAQRGEEYLLDFDPMVHWEGLTPPDLRRPYFLPIIASNALATMMVRKANGRVDGFIIEAPTAGGHNAPPRERGVTNHRGEPVYGERDVVDLDAIGELGLPFWLAGGSGTPEGLRYALDSGAHGIQVGTLFAYCQESGLGKEVRGEVLRAARAGAVDVLTDGVASPTGFPFKVVQLEDSLSDEAVYQKRDRVCDLGYLRTAYRRDDGRVDYRCPAEPVDTYVKKGGTVQGTEGKKCLCNALMADIGMGQKRDDGVTEPHLLTSGDGLLMLGQFLGDREDYSARDVIEHLEAGLALESRSSSPVAAKLG